MAALNLTSSGDVTLEAGDTLVVVDPKRDLSDAEYETIRAWIVEGGRMLFALSYETDLSTLSNFNKILDYYQLSFGDGVVQEDAGATSNWNGDQYTLRPNMDAENELTESLVSAGAYLMMPYSRPINPVAMPESGIRFSSVLTSSDKAVVMNGDEKSLPGTQTLAMTMLKQNADDSSKDVRIALIGNIYTLADTNLLNYSYNMNFTMNVFNWLVNRDTSVSISSKLLPDSTLAIPDSATAWTLAAVVVIAIPLIVLVAGIVVWIRRRRL